MFGKAKRSSHEKDEPLPPAPQLQDLTPANLAGSVSTEISCIGPGMTVVGKISSEGSPQCLRSRRRRASRFHRPKSLTAPKWKMVDAAGIQRMNMSSSISTRTGPEVVRYWSEAADIRVP